ncbi:chymotrypsinogen B-like [Asterias amurensis]|uniref:chymotrypsinogen B-like n=1 Tax=Asterias amurensis TaxID=7602 RepID=UPI003AB66204
MGCIVRECFRVVGFGMVLAVSCCNAGPLDRKGRLQQNKMVDFQGSGESPKNRSLTSSREEWLQTVLKTSKYNAEGDIRADRGQCGVMKVVGGHVADGDRWPWQAELVVKKTGAHVCGGTVVGNEHVLTAAHCFDRFHENEIIVRLGTRNRNRRGSNEQVYPISCLHIHGKYSRETKTNSIDYDIALLRLKTPVTKTSEPRGMVFNDHVAPACLPIRGEFQAGAVCIVTGWGYTDFTSLITRIMPSQLTEASVPLIRARTCRDAYPSLTNRMVCAGYMDGNVRADTCKGDSGGPLVCQSKEGKWKLWGVTSWGRNYFCNESPTDPAPGVYTRVDKFVKWIEKNMSKKACS